MEWSKLWGLLLCNLHIGTPYAFEETRFIKNQWYFSNFSCSRKLVAFYVRITYRLWRFLQFLVLQQVSHFLFSDHFQLYIPWCHEKIIGKPLFSKIDKMKICWGGRWAKASTPTEGPGGVCELEASRQVFLRDVGTMRLSPLLLMPT